MTECDGRASNFSGHVSGNAMSSTYVMREEGAAIIIDDG
jgi:hypothetical protein